ncbi:MAG: phage scaffolding protein [Bacilli bacterium]|nr:phage scaffolding protein [Bacilli bacterium]
MDWLKEILTNAGVEEEQVTKVIESVKKEVPKYYVPKNDFNEKVTELNNVTNEKNTMATQLEELKKTDPTKLQEEIDKAQATIKEMEANSKKELADVKRMSAIDLAIASSKTIDAISLKANLDLDKISYDEKTGVLSGIDEQINSVRETKKYLFEEAPTDGGMPQGAIPPKEKTIADEIKENIYGTAK